jgi:DNA-binding NarL/FixJ family response regulator
VGSVRRILFGDFGGVVRAGFDDVLRDQRVEVLRSDGRDVVDELLHGLPDVVVLDLDAVATPDLVKRLVREFPALKVVVCSSRRPLMQVYPPFHYGESYEVPLEPDAFMSALRT